MQLKDEDMMVLESGGGRDNMIEDVEKVPELDGMRGDAVAMGESSGGLT